MIRILLIFFLIYLVIRMLGRMLFPNTGSSNGGYEYQGSKGPKEGEVKVEDPGNGNNNTKKHLRKDVGDYVDYEEVD
ncbi:MAG TPA: hypothetical protein VE870_14935 [Bacteroidales bacterium]|nr:hypothetical protein [Bacteroidales bacterium]